jgi:hypothetical protein
VSKPTVRIQLVEAGTVTQAELIVRDAVDIQIEIGDEKFQRIIPLPRNRDEIRLLGFAPLTRD